MWIFARRSPHRRLRHSTNDASRHHAGLKVRLASKADGRHVCFGSEADVCTVQKIRSNRMSAKGQMRRSRGAYDARTMKQAAKRHPGQRRQSSERFSNAAVVAACFAL